MSRSYTASKTINRFINSMARVQMLLGPIGGGKTTGVLMKIIILSHAQKPNANGERRTRWGCVRNTRPQLKDSVLKTVFDWLTPDGKRIIWRESDMTLLLDIPLPDGTRVKSEILFRALDDENDARRLLSVEYTGVWFSEFREIPLALHVDALSRCGRYPSASDGGCSWYGLLAESNMPVRGSDWHRFIELERPAHAEVFIQPSGLSPEAENTEFLPPDYYITPLASASEGWIKAHIKCEYPDSLDGKAVFASTYDNARHVSKILLSPINVGTHSPPILMGIDQGRNPAAVFGQVQGDGRLNVISECFGLNMGMDKFCVQHVLPHIAQMYPGMPILAVLDPAGIAKSQTGEESPKSVLEGHGFRVVLASTNALDRRLEAVDRLLLRHNGILFSPDCRVLISAVAADYRFRTKKNGDLEDTPEKLHPVSDLADALQYLCLAAGGENYGRVMTRLSRKNRQPDPAPPVRGWA